MPIQQRRRFAILLLVLCTCWPSLAAGGDWPQWGCDAGRSHVSAAEMPAKLTLRWVRQLPKPEKAWPNPQYMLHFDRSYEPVVKGKRLFVGSMVRDRMTAYDTETGEETWRFYAGGPVRFAPAAHKDKLYFCSDDGFLYCLKAETGALLWKVRGGPDDRRGLGNGRLCSLWPARGAPVIYDDTVYFAASIWPFMGTFITALDAQTGKVVWCNSGNGSRWTNQPHGGAAAFSGVAPQGYLAATETFLVIPNGRTLPGVFDRATGRFVYSHMGSKWGGYDVRVVGDSMTVMGRRHTLATGGGARKLPGFPVGENQAFVADGRRATISRMEYVRVEAPDRRGRKRPVETLKTVWRAKVRPALADIRIKAGGRLYGLGAKGDILGVALLPGGKVEVDFKGEIKGKLWRLIAADDKLFAVTEEGRLICFGAGERKPKTHALQVRPLPNAPEDEWGARAKALLRNSDPAGGWCVSLGIGSGRLIDEIVRQSKLHVIVIDRDAAKVNALRRRMDDAGLYGRRVTALVGDPFDYDLPPYIASLIVCEDIKSAGLDLAKHKVQRLIRPLRPYGGEAFLPAGKTLKAVLKWADKGDLDGAGVRRVAADVVIRREGALPRAADWSHQYADAANSVVSQDDRVRLPLGLLWFGGNTHLDVLPRHGHGPTPQVAAGRLVIQGVDMISARDVYTGRVLWKRKIEGFSNFGMYWDRSFRTNQRHIAGANLWGSNYVTAADHVYLINGPDLLVLDASTGATAKTFRLPKRDGMQPNWGVVMMIGDRLIAAAEPVDVSKATKAEPKPGERAFRLEGMPGVAFNGRFGAYSRRLVALNRRSGKVLWSRTAVMAFRHNAIVASGDRVFVIDGLSAPLRKRLKTMGHPVPNGTLHAVDLATGKDIWQADKNITGTWLGYSKEHDILLQGGSSSRDRGRDETRKGLAAYLGRTGQLVWQDLRRDHSGPMILHNDTFITNGGRGGAIFDLKTGQPTTRRHPLTLEPVPWRWGRLYGCNTAIAGKHLMTFRSGGAGFYDLDRAGGTGNFGGFKAGCSSNLVPAGGVLNAPDYTRTCTCAYQNQTSLAMAHMPDVETWTYTDWPHPGAQPIKRVGINLGAPGDRMDGQTLWLDIPSVGARSPAVACSFEPIRKEKYVDRGKDKERLVYAGAFFRSHATTIASGPLPWVAASGAEDITVLKVQLAPKSTTLRKYTVRLIFAERHLDVTAGGRVFDVSLQDKVVREKFDIVKAAGGPRRSVALVYRDVPVMTELVVGLRPVQGRPILCGVELISER